MRRVYESEALHRDDDDPFSPVEEEQKSRNHINWTNVSHAIVPQFLRSRAIAVDIQTTKDSYEPDEEIHFGVTFANRLPIPVTLVTRTPKPWEWYVDGNPEGSKLPPNHPQDRNTFRFARSERKRFRRSWSGRVRVAENEWRAAERGKHTLSVEIDAVTGAENLRAETTFRIE
ncbi:hypothetical protein JCM30237_04390 [Halolamina litorea]|uniref:DUF7974 domain-containing protein n=1 Tax=Halolamina litorea TaxID=1515593 RepID=A0ABD6BPV4_9EURY|nr:hypothetical protein [Halolamina litorea]